MKPRYAILWISQMKFVTLVVVKSGPLCCCESDFVEWSYADVYPSQSELDECEYEYFYTDEYPTECELDQFERDTCSKYNIVQVRSVEWFTEVVGTQEECDEAAANCTKNTALETSKAALQSEQP